MRPLPDELLALPHRRDVSFSRLTTLGVGGVCRWLFEPVTEDQTAAFVRACHREGLPFKVLGGGSNLVVLGDIDIPVLRVAIPAMAVRDNNCLIAPASHGHISLSETAAKAGLSGFEHASGIPGSCGGALCMNAGIRDHEMVDVLSRFRFLTPEGELVDKAPEPGEFGYRSSFLRHRCIVLGLTLRLAESDPATVRAKMDRLREQRRETQPQGVRSAGCVFKNPVGDHAGRLIDAAGLKGLRVGDAQVSTVHANFLVNLGKATPNDFKELIVQVKEHVRAEQGVVLELEVEVWPTGNEP